MWLFVWKAPKWFAKKNPHRTLKRQHHFSGAKASGTPGSSMSDFEPSFRPGAEEEFPLEAGLRRRHPELQDVGDSHQPRLKTPPPPPKKKAAGPRVDPLPVLPGTMKDNLH